jgi:uncharacterized protein (TIGR03083 family)
MTVSDTNSPADERNSADERIARIDVGAAYRGLRERLTDLLLPLIGDGWNEKVPHCPNWTIRETVAHLVGVVDDGVNGNLAGAGTDEWTKVQIDKRVHVSGPQLLDDWNTYGPLMDARLTEVGLQSAQALFDAATHEHDLRFALNSPGSRDSDAVWVAVDFIRARIASRSGVALTLDGLVVVPSSVRTQLHLTSSAFDAMRVFGSRRTEPEIRSLNWSGDPSPVLATLPFALPTVALGE